MHEIITSTLYDRHYTTDRIRSFVCRQRRLTKKQQFVMDNYWPMIGVNFQYHALDLISLFGREVPTVLEIGFGTGLSLVTMAEQHPEKNFLGIEVYYRGIAACLAAAYQANITNLRVMHHDAIEVLEKMIPRQSLDMVQLFFPDPWPKTRHHKRRIVQTIFARQIKSKLKLGGFFHIATDWDKYAEHILEVINNIPGYKNMSLYNTYIPRPDSRPVTKFELLGQTLGHANWDLLFQRV